MDLEKLKQLLDGLFNKLIAQIISLMEGFFKKVPIEVGFATLHDAIFVGGKNLSNVLDRSRYPELKLIYDRAEKELHVTWNKQTSIVVSTNIKQYTPGEIVDRKVVQPSHPIIAGIASAQVETPMGHVFEGPGKGKTGKSK